MLRGDCNCAKKLTINVEDNWTRFCCVQACIVLSMTDHLATNGHEGFLRRAIELSRRASLKYCTGAVFGAATVKDGKMGSEGMKRGGASHARMWHAEMEGMPGA